MPRHSLRSGESDNSLELLLDTICNTLGGILFIALLVCLLAQNSGQALSTAEGADVGLARLRDYRAAQLHLEQLDGDHKALQNVRTSQEQLISSLKVGDAGDVEELAKLQIVAQSLSMEQAQADDRLKAVRSDHEQLNSELERATSELARAETEARLAEQQLEGQREKQTVRLRLPLERPTLKRQIPLLLCGGKIRRPFAYDEKGAVLGRNMQDVRLSAPRDHLSPNDFTLTGGFLIGDKREALAEVDQFMDCFSTNTDYVALAVWPDSYREFRILRDHLTALGYEYQLILLKADESIAFGASGRRTVQ